MRILRSGESSMKRLKVTAPDSLFSKLVRERANWTCERCGTYYPEGSRQGLDCSHFYTRSRRFVRWNPWNAAAHCVGCHSELGGNPVEFARWINDHLGWEKAGKLEVIANRPVRLKQHRLRDIKANLKASWEDMQARRKAGETGRIEFENPMPEGLV